MAATIQSKTLLKTGKPSLKYKIDCPDEVLAIAALPNEEGVIIGSADRSLSLWVKRETGVHWPAAREILPSQVTYLEVNWETKRLFAGCDNGTISEYKVSDDLNSIKHRRDILAHVGRVNGISFILSSEWLASCSKDRSFVWYGSENGIKCGSYQLEGRGSALACDAAGKTVFVGVHTGCITILRLSASSCEMTNNLRGHEDSVQSLTWDPVSSRLFSAGTDATVIVWDLGGRKGVANELQENGLQYHDKEVTAVVWCSQLDSLISASLDGFMVFWDMKVTRQETPRWQESDACQMENCRSPFIWNFKKMWEDRTMGGRQHHCRVCGRAACENCSAYQSVYPFMGFEKEVRLCKECHSKLTDEDRRSYASIHDAKHPVMHVSFDPATMLLFTAGRDKIVKAWDITPLRSKN